MSYSPKLCCLVSSKMMRAPDTTQLDDVQATLYDRQIRLWGMKTQERLSGARVLIVGCTGINCEAAKNLVLAGVSVTFAPGDPALRRPAIAAAHCMFNCLISGQLKNSAATNADDDAIVQHTVDRLRELNPFASVVAMPRRSWEERFSKSFSSDPLGDDTLAPYTALVLDAGSASMEALTQLNAFCRSNNQGFFVSHSLGPHGALFQDLGPAYVAESANGSGADSTTALVSFPSLKDALATPLPCLPSGFSARRCALPHEKLVAFFVFLRNTGLPDSHNIHVYQQALNKAGYTAEPSPQAVQFWTDTHRLNGVPFPTASAAVGGLLTQQVQSFIAKTYSDLQNFILFDGATCEGLVFNVNVAQQQKAVV